MAVKKYEPRIIADNFTMTVACTQGDAIAPGGVLADATDATKPCIGFASRDVSAADITAGGDRAKISLYQDWIEQTTGLTAGQRVYLKASTTSGSTTTTTRPSTAGNLIQPLAIAISTTIRRWQVQLPLHVVQASGSSTVAFG